MESKQRQTDDVDLWPHTGVLAQIHTHVHTHIPQRNIFSPAKEKQPYLHMCLQQHKEAQQVNPSPSFLTTVTNNGKDMGQDGQGSLSVLVGISA